MRKEQKKSMKNKKKFKMDPHDSRHIWALWVISKQLKGRFIRRKFEASVKRALTLKKSDTLFERKK